MENVAKSLWQMEEGMSVLKRELELEEKVEGRERLLTEMVKGEVGKLFANVNLLVMRRITHCSASYDFIS